MRSWVALLALWVGAAGAVPSSQLIDDFRDASRWQASASDQVQVRVAGDGRGATCLHYDFGRVSGYAVARRTLALELPAHYAFTLRLRGSGPPNAFQLKLVDASGDNVWWRQWPDFSPPARATDLRIRQRQISFAWGPTEDKQLRRAAALELVVASGKGGGAGQLCFEQLTLHTLDAPRGADVRRHRAVVRRRCAAGIQRPAVALGRPPSRPGPGAGQRRRAHLAHAAPAAARPAPVAGAVAARAGSPPHPHHRRHPRARPHRAVARRLARPQCPAGRTGPAGAAQPAPACAARRAELLDGGGRGRRWCQRGPAQRGRRDRAAARRAVTGAAGHRRPGPHAGLGRGAGGRRQPHHAAPGPPAAAHGALVAPGLRPGGGGRCRRQPQPGPADRPLHPAQPAAGAPAADPAAGPAALAGEPAAAVPQHRRRRGRRAATGLARAAAAGERPALAAGPGRPGPGAGRRVRPSRPAGHHRAPPAAAAGSAGPGQRGAALAGATGRRRKTHHHHRPAVGRHADATPRRCRGRRPAGRRGRAVAGPAQQGAVPAAAAGPGGA